MKTNKRKPYNPSDPRDIQVEQQHHPPEFDLLSGSVIFFPFPLYCINIIQKIPKYFITISQMSYRYIELRLNMSIVFFCCCKCLCINEKN